ncbi:rhodanese-like domain-containing protein [Ectothiorhodospira lacustris]|uniref:rhodanese-like domain-containing protein n=1 Tax=Ectothiorhodospira lacustris TaxID=2899127 RepID=UPI001EE85B2F|nr:rhodanese-like domain-containing protein [Ectothiorhodospira lacustris]MCG5501327.1 sulfurtransferase [Ectothiorhodospira lacustris]
MSDSLPLVIEPKALASRLEERNLLIIDLSKPQIFMQAHLPGAVAVDFRRLQRTGSPVPGLIPGHLEMEALLSEIGLTPDRHVVAYDDEGGGWAGRFLWLLETIGHRHYSYLNGGIHAWVDDELPIKSGSPSRRPQATEYRFEELDSSTHVDLEYLLAHHKDPDVVVWDARSFEEYAGIQIIAHNGGHIPGAVHFEWTSALDQGRSLRIRDRGTLLKELAILGITPDKEVITHCQTHHRSGLTWLVGRLLGFPRIRAYPGSWAEWGNTLDAPYQQEQVRIA